jgi:palmitoyltransferase
MTPLHWAAVKGSKVSIKHLVEAGADLDAKEAQGKTPRDMAEELRGLLPFEKGLEEAGYTSLGAPRLGRLSEVSHLTLGLEVHDAEGCLA